MIEFRKYNKIAGIYKWENKVNHKCYIGQSIDIGSRLRHHVYNYNNKRYINPLYRAFDKYGIDQFDVEILFEVPNPEPCLKLLLDQLEIGYIEMYNSYGSGGYNLTRGGDAGILGYRFTKQQRLKVSENSKKAAVKLHRKVYFMSLESEEILQFDSVQKAADYFCLPHSSISRVCSWNQLTIKSKWVGAYDEDLLQLRLAQVERIVSESIHGQRPFTRLRTRKRPAPGLKRHFNTTTGKKILPEEQKEKIRSSSYKYKVEIYRDDELIRVYNNTLESNEFFNFKDTSRISNQIRKYNKYGYKFKKYYTAKLVKI